MIAYTAVCAVFWICVIFGTLGACRFVEFIVERADRRRSRLGRQR